MSYAYVIFLETCRQAEVDKERKDSKPFSAIQANIWYKQLPEFAKENLIKHTFMREPTIKDISDFYWGD